jgi:hypothetical protein
LSLDVESPATRFLKQQFAASSGFFYYQRRLLLGAAPTFVGDRDDSHRLLFGLRANLVCRPVGGDERALRVAFVLLHIPQSLLKLVDSITESLNLVASVFILAPKLCQRGDDFPAIEPPKPDMK